MDLTELLPDTPTHPADRPDVVRGRAATRRGVQRCAELLRSNFGDALPLDQVAELSGLRKEHLVRAFHRDMGLPPHRYLMRIRVTEALKLIETGQHTATEIAARCGFCDQSHMNRWFRRLLGTTPGAYARGRRAQLRAVTL